MAVSSTAAVYRQQRDQAVYWSLLGKRVTSPLFMFRRRKSPWTRRLTHAWDSFPPVLYCRVMLCQVSIRDTTDNAELSAIQIDEESTLTAEETTFEGFVGEVGWTLRVSTTQSFHPSDRSLKPSLDERVPELSCIDRRYFAYRLFWSRLHHPSFDLDEDIAQRH